MAEDRKIIQEVVSLVYRVVQETRMNLKPAESAELGNVKKDNMFSSSEESGVLEHKPSSNPVNIKKK